ncbi:hypothetical protein [Alkalimonas mucilaginosa]|uniref:Uncharacterized protein n=1 Tax=Alkalimonas mucilaginosa TaxID=3057676 RepID=A0ABU7JHS9_9GAMM|nr:hypothetical protein [Alkalimonas sp. MEB004]MEE2025025.1 hypothetical protein [Alkalimonas sp. MEB004]
MGQPVTVYRWDDPGAPQLSSRTPSEIIDILTKCLVDGYGTKAPLGWTRPFYNASTQAVAFRNNVSDGGSGGYVKFFSDNGSNSAGALMRITHAVSMTAINELFHQGYTQAFELRAGIDRWALIGTSTSVYFFVSRDVPMSTPTSGINQTMFFGDYYPAISSDVSRCISIVSPSLNNDTGYGWSRTLDWLSSNGNFNGINCLLIFDADGYAQNRSYGLSVIYPTDSTSSAIFNDVPAQSQITYPVFIKMIGESGVTTGTDRMGTALFNSSLSPTYRGVLPGLVQMIYAGWRSYSWPTLIDVHGCQHWLLRNPSNGPCMFAIKLDEWINPYVPV